MANFLCPVQSTSVHLPQFYNLVETYELNSLSVRLQRSIWTPVMSFPNARQAEGTLVDGGSSTIVLKLGSPLGDKISRSTEAQIYEGVDCPLVMKREDPYRVIYLAVIVKVVNRSLAVVVGRNKRMHIWTRKKRMCVPIFIRLRPSRQKAKETSSLRNIVRRIIKWLSRIFFTQRRT